MQQAYNTIISLDSANIYKYIINPSQTLIKC